MNNNQNFYHDLANRIRNNIINNRNNDLNIINNVNNDNFANIIRNYFIEYAVNQIDAVAAEGQADHNVPLPPEQEVMAAGGGPPEVRVQEVMAAGGGPPEVVVQEVMAAGPPEVVVQDTTDDIAVPKCRICMENTCVVVFVPCGHVCSCTECSDRVDSCPVCRAEITRKQGLFFA